MTSVSGRVIGFFVLEGYSMNMRHEFLAAINMIQNTEKLFKGVST
jgi:hypothetical protein